MCTEDLIYSIYKVRLGTPVWYFIYSDSYEIIETAISKLEFRYCCSEKLKKKELRVFADSCEFRLFNKSMYKIMPSEDTLYLEKSVLLEHLELHGFM